MGVLGGILFSGIAFGVYHLRFSQVLPLCMIGVFLAYLVWRTGSLWPAVVVHFVNNAIAVVLAAFASRNQALDMADMERVQVPWYLVVAGLLLFAALMRSLHRMTMDRHARAGHARELGKVGYAGDAEDAGDADGTFPGGWVDDGRFRQRGMSEGHNLGWVDVWPSGRGLVLSGCPGAVG